MTARGLRGVTRRLTVLVAAGLMTTLVAGCGTAAEQTAAADRSTTVGHRFGTTTVVGTPTRVVAASSQWLDALLQFEVQPVGYLSVGPMGDERGLLPWESEVAAEAVELDESAATQIAAPLPEEQIASLQPDLVLGSLSISDQASFDRMSRIAPTIAALGDGQVDSWDAQVEILGRILGQEERARAIVDSTNTRIDALAARLPGLRGKTAVLSQFVFGTGQLVVVADPTDGASAVFARLGMTLPSKLVAEAGASGGRLVLSPERVDALTADLVVMLPNGGTTEDLMKLPGFPELPSVQSGGMAIGDYATVTGFNTPSASSIRYSLERVTPQLESVAAQ